MRQAPRASGWGRARQGSLLALSCALLAAANVAAFLTFAGWTFWQELPGVEFLFFTAIGVASAAPLLMGAATARRRLIDADLTALERS